MRCFYFYLIVLFTALNCTTNKINDKATIQNNPFAKEKPQLEIQIIAPDIVENRSPIHFLFKIKNNGPVSATRCKLVVKLPPSIRFIRASRKKTKNKIYSQSHSLEWRIGTLVPNELVIHSASFSAEKPGVFTTRAALSCREGIVVKKISTTKVKSLPQIHISVLTDNKQVAVGKRIHYKVEITNKGFSRATNIMLNNYLPNHTTYHNAWQQDSNNQILREGKILFAEMNALKPQEKIIYHIVVNIIGREPIMFRCSANCNEVKNETWGQISSQ